MSRRTRIWLFAGIGLLAWIVLAWLLGGLLGLEGRELRLVRLGLPVLGVVAAGVLVWYFLAELREQEGPNVPVEGDEIALAIGSIQRRLAETKAADERRLSQLPLVLCLGPVGSGKTTVISRSGLDPDLLVGEVQRGEAIVATGLVNAWYRDQTVFLEVGGPLLADAGKFGRLIRLLRPSPLRAALSGRRQAPRVVIVCVSVEELLGATSGEQLDTTARDLRARLLAVAQRLGIALPVYVIFTKADRIPYFGDFVRQFSADEAREVLGATLPWDVGPATTYTERTARRLAVALERLGASLGGHRLRLLRREAQPTAQYGVYEFPREFNKSIPFVSQFLLELCKPSQLQASPVLRGFYFSGVRALVSETEVQQREESRGSAPPRLDATSAFNPMAPRSVPSTQRVMRKVPDWMFLTRLFREVILSDHVALAATGGGARVNRLRRALLAVTAVVAITCCLAFLTSYLRNRALLQQVELAVRTASAASARQGSELANEASLARLDTLRAVTAKLSAFEQRGVPLGLRWGLYSGSAVYRHERGFYFARFDSLLLTPAVDRILAELRSLPDQPTDTSDYAATYARLKVYLVVTSNAKKSSAELLVPELTAAWESGRDAGDFQTQLASAQFRFFALELARSNPLPASPDQPVVDRTRAYLNKFKGGQQIYQVMLAAAGKAWGAKPFDFDGTFPGAPVTTSSVIPGAFTRAGWAFMQDSAFRNTDQFFKGEEWVTGTAAMSVKDQRAVIFEMRRIYRDEYINRWRTLLSKTRVAPFGSIADASRKLQLIGSNPSPLLRLLNAVAVNTAVDSQVAAVFQPVTVVSPADTAKLIGDKAQPYMQALQSAGMALQNVASAPPGQTEGPVQEAKGQAAAAQTAASNIPLAFSGNPAAAGVGSDVRRLLESPVVQLGPMLGNVGVRDINGAGGNFCQKEGRLFSKVPFALGGATASVSEVSEVLQRNGSALSNLYNTQLTKYLLPQGAGYAANPASGVRVNPRFVEFISRASQVSKALYPEGQTGPRLTFGFRPLMAGAVTQVALTVDGSRRVFTRTRASEQTFDWVGLQAQSAKLEITIGNATESVSFSGPWALWRVFAEARSWRGVGGLTQAELSVRHEGTDVPLAFEVNVPSAPSIFNPGWLAGLACVSTIALP